jgi:sulfatase maturation enzyme AslB (radical SAM superfamily)
MTANTVCVVPFMAMNVQEEGYLKPCCEYVEPKDPRNMRNFREYHVWWRKDLEVIRNELRNGIQHTNCSRCFDREKIGVGSYRMMMNKNYPDNYANIINTDVAQPIAVTAPKYVHIDIGNTCNLKCIMCHPKSSSSIASEYQTNARAYKRINIDNDTFINSFEHKWFKSDDFVQFQKTILPGAEEIFLTGGEPMMVPESLSMLQSVANPETIEISMTTNGTWLNDQWMDTFKRFKKIKIGVSVDGVGAHGEYVRYGSEWTTVSANIQKLLTLDNVQLVLTTVIQHTSAYTLIDLLKFYLTLPDTKGSFIYSILDRPLYLHINSVPESAINQFRSDLDAFLSTSCPNTWQNRHLMHGVQAIKKYLDSYKFDPEMYEKYTQYISMLDSIRGTDYNTTFGIV